jgi:RNA polymerase sigma-70 factor (ECF subfamily)
MAQMSSVVGLGEQDWGNSTALAARLYRELKSMARSHLSRERSGHTLQATALVHEAYLRLAKMGEEQLNREQFLALASITMRRVLIDYARTRKAARRGNAALQVTLDQALISSELNLDVFALERALEDLELMDARPVRIVEMRVFGGLTNDEIAALLKVSSRTVKRDWVMARAWLQERLDSGMQE